jgi:hypothetical protein
MKCKNQILIGNHKALSTYRLWLTAEKNFLHFVVFVLIKVSRIQGFHGLSKKRQKIRVYPSKSVVNYRL